RSSSPSAAAAPLLVLLLEARPRPMPPFPARLAAYAVLLVAVLANCIGVLLLEHGQPGHYIDDGVIAFRLLAGQGYSLPFRGPAGPTAAYLPAMPLLLAAIHALLGAGNPALLAVLLLKLAIRAGTACVVFRIARLWVPTWLAALAGALVGAHP